MSRNIQVKDADESIVTYGNPANPPPLRTGYTNYLGVPDQSPRAAGDTTSVERWQNGAAVWVPAPVTLATLSTALNMSLTTLFKTAPIQAQVVFSNISSPIAKLISAGQLAQAATALQGMLDDDLVPSKYSAIITAAIAQITAQEATFAAVMPPAA